MDFIEAMKEVYLTSEQNKREEQAWRRRQEERLWHEGASANNLSVDDSDVVENRTRRVSRENRTGMVFAERQALDSELERVMGQMQEPIGSLSSVEGDSDRPPSHRAPDTPPTYNSLQPPLGDQIAPRDPAHPSQTMIKEMLSRRDNDDTQTKAIVTEVDSEEDEEEDDSMRRKAVDAKDDHMSPELKSELMDIIRKLSEEQQALKAKISEHDEHLSSLIQRQPSIQRRLTSKGTRMSSAIVPLTPPKTYNQNPLSVALKDEEHIYAQIEQLYSNLCRITLPFNNGTPEIKMMSRTKGDNTFSADTAEVILLRENKELREKIEDLENRLKLSETSSKESKPTPSNEIESLKFTEERPSSPALYCNTNSAAVNTISHRSVPDPYAFSDIRLVKTTYEWNISNYSKKMKMEMWGKRLNTISDAFHIGHNGYLARLEVYLNGNGSGYDKGLSVFLRIIKGKFDDSLTWPARFSLTFVLLNQEDKGVDSLSFGSEGKFFKFEKPPGVSDDQSDSWGLVEFVPHSVMATKKYVKDDIIKLQVAIVKQP